MRQTISTAVVAVVVGAVAGATMGAVAQSGPDATAQQAIVPSVTSINAHKVDGRHSVGASASRKRRAGKLVATNRQGYLPINIIKPAWRLIGGKPAAFRDGRITWGEVQDKPPGFADGVDSVGYVSEVTGPYSIGSGASMWVFADAPVSADVELTIIPAPGTPWMNVDTEQYSRGPVAFFDPLAAGYIRKWYLVENVSGATTFKVRSRVYGTGIAPAALARVARKVEVGVSKKGPGSAS